ncbi:MAG: patatin-like phospholipase family protein [Chloroflexi bacterium]|nr:patatin-like phospholipase family protein [Chloroflexota bacterium]
MTATRPKIGLALSGGGTRGLVHIGVLSVLVKAGIPIDYVAGTSVGSFVGAVFCAGMPVDQMRALALSTSWKLLSRPALSHSALLSFRPLETWVEQILGDVDICDLGIPFAVITADLERGEKVVLRRGPVARAVHASCAIPGIVEPVEIDGRLLCDGGIVDNLPIHVVRDMGADYVIGADIFVPSHYHRMGPLGTGLMTIETLVRHSGGHVGEADCLITPQISGHAYHRFSKAQEFFHLGEDATRRALPTIKAALSVSSIQYPVSSVQYPPAKLNTDY